LQPTPLSHISLDRVLGYGLKSPTPFQFTHIQSAANPVMVPNYPHPKEK
jgi:hypothetical protein